MNVLLHSVAAIDGRTDLRKHLVPRTTHLCVKVATQRLEIFVQLPVVISGTHAQMCRTIQAISETNGQRTHPLAAPRPLDDHFVHIRAHGGSPERSKHGSRVEYMDEIPAQSTTERVSPVQLQ